MLPWIRPTWQTSCGPSLGRLTTTRTTISPNRPRQQKRSPPMSRQKPLDHKTLQAEGTGLEPATPLLGHHISSVAANHSLTLRNCLRNIILRLALLPVKGRFALCAQRARKSGCIWMTKIGPECGRHTREVGSAECGCQPPLNRPLGDGHCLKLLIVLADGQSFGERIHSRLTPSTTDGGMMLWVAFRSTSSS